MRTFHYTSVARQITREEYDQLIYTADLIIPIDPSQHKQKFPFCILNGALIFPPKYKKDLKPLKTVFKSFFFVPSKTFLKKALTLATASYKVSPQLRCIQQ
jgi:hypothetical protein